jgi:hypothetical protein
MEGVLTDEQEDLPVVASVTVMKMADGSVQMAANGITNAVEHLGLLAVGMGLVQAQVTAPATPQVIPVTRLPNGMRLLN